MKKILNKIMKSSIGLVLVIVCFAAGCSKPVKQKEINLKAALETNKFEKVSTTITMEYTDTSVSSSQSSATTEEGQVYGDTSATDTVTQTFAWVTKYGDVYYQETDGGPKYYYVTEDGVDYIYYYNDFGGLFKDEKFNKYAAEDFEETQGKTLKMSYEFFSSITPEMFDYSIDDSATCRVTDEYERAVIQTIFPNNSFEGLSDISLDFILSGKQVSSIIYRYSFENFDFKITYALDYAPKEIQVPTDFIDQT